MQDSIFHINKANNVISNINEYLDNRYSAKCNHSLSSLVIETELILFGYSNIYPALLDIKLMKERYDGRENGFEEVIGKKLVSILISFISFIKDYNI